MRKKIRKKNETLSNIFYAIGIVFNWLFIGSLITTVVCLLLFISNPYEMKSFGIVSLIALVIAPISFFISMGIFSIAIDIDPTPSPSGKYDHKEYEFS